MSIKGNNHVEIKENFFGHRNAGTLATVLIGGYLTLTALLLLYTLFKFWTNQTTPGETGSNVAQIVFLFWKVSISDENRLLLLVMLAGALGGIIHALRSLSWYIGNRALVMSWLPRYIIMPIVGSILSVLFYLVIRGGFFSTQASVEQTSPFMFVAVGGLVGMFAEQAIAKLRGISETIFGKSELQERGKDTVIPFFNEEE